MAIDISDLRRVAEATARLGLPHAFTGGAVLPLLRARLADLAALG